MWVDTGTGFSEDTAWLSQTIWERPGQGVIYAYKEKRFPDLRAVLSNGANLKCVAAYTLSGKKVGSLQPVPAGSVRLERVFNTFSTGIYLLVIETRMNGKLLMRWAKTK